MRAFKTYVTFQELFTSSKSAMETPEQSETPVHSK